MSFLLGNEYASSSESDSEEETTSPQVNAEGTEQRKPSAELLPSADSVLSSVTASKASFLPPKSTASEIKSVKSFDLLKEREEQRVQEEKEERARKEDEDAAQAAQGTRKRPPPPATATQPVKKEKKDGKDRVKGQRLKGQAGIGSDFRGWKSETEMALRQQFD